MLKFRNINATPDDPVENWGTEGILSALEEGVVEHWFRVAQAAKDPDSEVAFELQEVLTMCSCKAAVIWIENQLAQIRATPESRVAMKLKELLLQSGLTQKDFAQALGTSQSRFSTYLSARVTPSAAFVVRAEDLAASVRN